MSGNKIKIYEIQIIIILKIFIPGYKRQKIGILPEPYRHPARTLQASSQTRTYKTHRHPAKKEMHN